MNMEFMRYISFFRICTTFFFCCYLWVLFFIGADILFWMVIFSLVSLLLYIKWSKKKQIAQKLRDDGPLKHLETKINTPTMGGLFFLLPFYLYYWFVDKSHSMIMDNAVLLSVMFAGIGLLDDILKVFYKKDLTQKDDSIKTIKNRLQNYFLSRRGLKVKEKLFLQLLSVIVFCYFLPLNDLSIPLFGFKNLFLLIPFIILVTIGTANAVNLTDGLDGLLVLIFIPLLYFISNYLQIYLQPLDIFLTVFLIFNAPKAKIFMGDVGSMGLGALLAGVFIGKNQMLSLVFIGLFFVIEAISVIIQVFYYKITRKRLLMMSPIHHHFEYKGYSEGQIVSVAFVLNLIWLYFLSYFILYLI